MSRPTSTPPSRSSPEKTMAIAIIALVNYKRFWDSGMARQMIDMFYRRLPYPPPVLYLDVLTLAGGNFHHRRPQRPVGRQQGNPARRSPRDRRLPALKRNRAGDGRGSPLGPSRRLAAGRYVWFHCRRLLQRRLRRDHGRVASRLAGASCVWQSRRIQCVADRVDPRRLANVRDHYDALLAGKPRQKNAGPGHLARRRTRRGTKRRVQHSRGRGPLPGRLDRPGQLFLPDGHSGDLSCRQAKRSHAIQQASCTMHLGTYRRKTGRNASPPCRFPSFVSDWRKGAAKIGPVMLGAHRNQGQGFRKPADTR